MGEVANDVWIGQEPGWDSPINRGSHCCKGAAVRDDVLSERRLRYPMKLVNGMWNRISWDRAIDEIGDKLMDIRRKSGPESVYWLGSAKFTNEAAYLNRKLAAFWEPTIPITKRASVTLQLSPAWPIRGATAR
jgi:formate dehydrogenase major subunit